MKTLNLTLIIAAVFLLASCQKESDIPAELSAADKIATEGMEEAEHEALEHNEELAVCADSNNCTPSAIQTADSLFHYQSDMFDFHHANYSHNNLDDDHHHSAVSTHSHGNAEHAEEEEGADHGHSQESHYEMVELRAEHEQYHPN
ncbi:MAG: hypothetical protein COA97_09005 [Flavobacteriales bacterium]|nr:MAG: hypothetical protein COA97_09005 [Flavobacteriales bacterium]